MKTGLALVAAMAAMVVSCGPKTLVLPADPLDRAATCGVVTAAAARKAAGLAKLPIADQMRIMHFAILTGAQDKGFARDRAAKVLARMREIESGIGSGKWENLVAPCADAFPQTQAGRGISLPSDPLDAQLACYMLADFVERGLDRQGTYGNDLSGYTGLKLKLDPGIGRALARRGISGASKTRQERDTALSAAARLGSPPEVMELCFTRYGEKPPA
jgi:hypothetical protein